MTIVSVQKSIPASSAKVWEVLSDFGGIHRVHPYVERSPLVGERSGGVGAQRICYFHDGNQVKEEVKSWAPGESMTIEVVEGSMPLSRAVATISLEDHSDSTLVKFTMDYVPKWGPVGKLMDMMMMRRQFTKVLGEVIDGIETHIATGAVVGKGGVPIAAAAMA